MVFHKFCPVSYQVFLSTEQKDKDREKTAVVINYVIHNFKIKYIGDQKLHSLYQVKTLPVI